MSNQKCRSILIAAAVTGLCVQRAFGGFTLNTLATFNGANGLEPESGLTLSGNMLYGTTEQGTGSAYYGTVFSVPITGGSPTTLATFSNNNGNPEAGLTLSGNTLYGATLSNTIFSVPITGGIPTTLATFPNLTFPTSTLTLSGTTLYGTTQSGGTSNAGTVFSVPISGGTPTTLASFTGAGANGNGQDPFGQLVLSGNTLYGTTIAGGLVNWGTVFSVPTTGGTLTDLASFNSYTGEYPYGGLTLIGSTLYGTTGEGPAAYNGFGTVFSVNATGGFANSSLATFNQSNGQDPLAGLTLVGNMLYGTTYVGGISGGQGNGTVFSIPLAGGTPATVARFNGSNGSGPYLGNLILSGSTLYGTTSQGGANNDGTVFSLTANPILSLTAAPPTAFGPQVGTLTGSASFTATPTGYLAVSGWNLSAGTEVFALELTDSTPANLAADLADAASEINDGTYTGYTVSASTTAPLGLLGDGYNFYITITDDTLVGNGSPYFGFDFTQLNGTADTLSVTGAEVPEPASISLLGIAIAALLGRRRLKHG